MGEVVRVDGEVGRGQLQLEGGCKDEQVGVGVLGEVLQQFLVQLVLYLQPKRH